MKIVIIGGGAGGATTAARARRLDEQAEIVIFERGEHVSYAHCGLPYYIGGVIKDRNSLLISNPQQMKSRYRIEARIRSQVKAIKPDGKMIEVVDLHTGKQYQESYDKLVLSPGAEAIRPSLPGIDSEGIFTLRNLTDADVIVKFITERQPGEAVVVGGGFIGLEMAENFKIRGIGVTVVEMLDQVMPNLDHDVAVMVQQTLKTNGIRLVLADAVASFARSKGRILVTLKSGLELNCDMVMLSIGVKPNIELAGSAGLEIGNRGGIKVNEYMQTSNPDIFAVGDSVETTHMVTGEPSLIALAGPANRQGRLVADNIYGRKVAYRGTLGTSVVRLFDRTAAATGANEKTLQRLGLPYQKCYLHPFSHATYYPNATQMAMKLLFSPGSGRILGAQIVGDDGVDKRIDVLATAIMAGMGVEDLTHLELGYVPQYGSAKDPVNIAGYVASNIVRGDVSVAYWDEVSRMTSDKDVLLDVRTKEEFSQDAAPLATNLPLDELRSRLGELDKDATIYPYCRVGQRSYIATRILKQHGFDVKNISGGFLTYKTSKPDGVES